MIPQRVACSLVVVACALAATSCATAPQVDRAAQAHEAQMREAQKRENEMREAQAREAQRLAEIERERAAAEERRQREPQTGKVTVPEPVAAQPLAAIEEKPVEPAAPAVAPAPAAPAEKPRLASAIDHSTLALQLSRDLRALRAEVETLQTLHTPRGWVLSVDAAELFPAGEAGITPEAARKLDPLARVLAHYAARGIVIDRVEGEDNVAESLAASRAEALRTGLEAHGVPAERIAARSTGERLEFLVPNDEQAFNAAAGR